MKKYLLIVLLVGVCFGQEKQSEQELLKVVNELKNEIQLLRKEMRYLKYDMEDLEDEVKKSSRRASRSTKTLEKKQKELTNEIKKSKTNSVVKSPKQPIYQDTKQIFKPVTDLLNQLEEESNKSKVFKSSSQTCQYDDTSLKSTFETKIDVSSLRKFIKFKCTNIVNTHYYWIPE